MYIIHKPWGLIGFGAKPDPFYCSGQSLDPESRIPNPESRIPNPESRISYVYVYDTEMPKKSLWSFAYVLRQDQVNKSRNAVHATRTCEIFVYSAVKITIFYG